MKRRIPFPQAIDASIISTVNTSLLTGNHVITESERDTSYKSTVSITSHASIDSKLNVHGDRRTLTGSGKLTEVNNAGTVISSSADQDYKETYSHGWKNGPSSYNAHTHYSDNVPDNPIIALIQALLGSDGMVKSLTAVSSVALNAGVETSTLLTLTSVDRGKNHVKSTSKGKFINDVTYHDGA